MIPVIWLTFNDTPARCRWDQDILDVLCPSSQYTHWYLNQSDDMGADGAVVVFASGSNEEYIPQLNRFIAGLEWVVLVLTSDECATFPWHNVHHPNMKLWVQYARTDRHRGDITFFPIGCPPLNLPDAPPDKTIDIGFSGQITHLGREQMLWSLESSPGADLNPTEGFSQGYPRNEYLSFMARTKVAPCPSGPCHVDSFRLYEALESGCVPILDQGPRPDEQGRAVAGFPHGFWEKMFGHPPIPIIDGWSQAPGIAESILNDYPAVNNVASAWWQRKKREFRQRLLNDVRVLSGGTEGLATSEITVLIPTSPTPNNPDTSHIIETIASVRERLDVAEILVMFDGVRSEQEHRRANYLEYTRQLLWTFNRSDNIVPFVYEQHLHQAEMFRRTLEQVTTPYILWVEHDTPLIGDIPFLEWMDKLDEGYDIIRTYHETVLQPEHLHLMGEQYGDYLATNQFSARPHLARTSWYRKTLDFHFPANSKWMIEDKLHGAAQDEPDSFKMLLYTPPGNIQRAGHLDARGDDEKWVDS